MGLIMVTARILSDHQTEDGTDGGALKEIVKYSILPILIILKENLSTAGLLILAIYMMMYIAKMPWKQLLSLLGIGVAAVVLGIITLINLPESLADKGEFGSKVITWKTPYCGCRQQYTY